MAKDNNTPERALRRQADAAADILKVIAGEDDADLVLDTVEGETDLFEAIDAALAAEDECDAIIAGCKDREETFKKRRAAAQSRKESLRGALHQALLTSGIEEKIKRPTGTVYVSNLAATYIIEDEAQIPATYWKKPDPVLDKAALAKDFKAGEDIPGVGSTDERTSINVRRA